MYLCVGCEFRTIRGPSRSETKPDKTRFQGCRKINRDETRRRVHVRASPSWRLRGEGFTSNLGVWYREFYSVTTTANYYDCEFIPLRSVHTKFSPSLKFGPILFFILYAALLSQSRPLIWSRYELVFGLGWIRESCIQTCLLLRLLFWIFNFWRENPKPAD